MHTMKFRYFVIENYCRSVKGRDRKMVGCIPLPIDVLLRSKHRCPTPLLTCPAEPGNVALPSDPSYPFFTSAIYYLQRTTGADIYIPAYILEIAKNTTYNACKQYIVELDMNTSEWRLDVLKIDSGVAGGGGIPRKVSIT